MVKISAHFTNALKREHDRLGKRHDAVSAKIGKLVDEQNELTDQMKKIDEQLASEAPAEPETAEQAIVSAKGGMAA